jgi:hypothetical protein
MRPSKLVLGLATLALSTAGADNKVSGDKVAETKTEAQQLMGNALVWVDAQMFLDGAATGPSIRLAALDLGREEDVGYVVPMRILGTRGELVQVEPTPDVECAWWRAVSPAGLEGLRLWVKRTDLAPVLVKPFKAKFKDGSSIDLQPGVPVLNDKVAFHEGRMSASVPKASLGIAYKPYAIKPPKPGKATFLLDEKTSVKLGDQEFTFGPWTAGAATTKGKRMLVTIAARCMTAVISAPKERVHKNISLGRGAMASEPPPAPKATSGDRYYLAAGTKLTSETGDQVIATLTLDKDILKPTKKRACGEFVVTRVEEIATAPHTRDTAQPSRTLRLCAPADQVKVEKR